MVVSLVREGGLLFSAALAVLVFGCSDPAGAAEQLQAADLVAPWKSGGRLRAMVNVSGDAASFSGWWDLELELECAFVQTLDGLRCLPNTRRVLSGYRDSDCVEPLVQRDSCDLGGEFVRLSVRDAGSEGCVPTYGAFVLDSSHTGDRYLSSEQGCERSESVAPSSVTEPIPLTAFVRGRRSLAPVGDFSVLQIRADDGSERRLDAVMSATTFCELDPVELDPIDVGSGPLQAVWSEGPDGAPLLSRPEQWRDPATGRWCRAKRFSEGIFCVGQLDVLGETGLPPGPFADANCTVPTRISTQSAPPTGTALQFAECPYLRSNPMSVLVHEGELFVGSEDECEPTEREPDVHYLIEEGRPPELEERIE